jgi:hypothetical protein
MSDLEKTCAFLWLSETEDEIRSVSNTVLQPALRGRREQTTPNVRQPEPLSQLRLYKIEHLFSHTVSCELSPMQQIVCIEERRACADEARDSVLPSAMVLEFRAVARCLSRANLYGPAARCKTGSPWWEGICLETGLRYFGGFTNPFSRINLANTVVDP